MAQAAETHTTNPSRADRMRSSPAEDWDHYKRKLLAWLKRLDTFGRDPAGGKYRREMEALEVAILQGAIATPADAAAKLAVAAMYFERVTDGDAQMEAIQEVAQWLDAAPVQPARSPGGEDARFLRWERKARYWWGRSGEPGIGDDATDALVDRFSAFETLILQTPSEGLTAARIKAEVILGYSNDCLGDPSRVPAMKAVAAALRGVV